MSKKEKTIKMGERNKSVKEDPLLQLAISRGYVPPKCNLAGGLIMALMNSGEDPCAGCNADRKKCGGRPKK